MSDERFDKKLVVMSLISATLLWAGQSRPGWHRAAPAPEIPILARPANNPTDPDRNSYGSGFIKDAFEKGCAQGVFNAQKDKPFRYQLRYCEFKADEYVRNLGK